MFGLFRTKKEKLPNVVLADLHNNLLKEGDHVRSLRYDLGKSILRKGADGYFYESLESGKQVHFSRMIDAATSRQKVEKIENIKE